MLYIILMHISRFMFFANDLYYWLFWYLAYINDVRQKKQIWVIFLVWIKKWVIKQWRQLTTSAMSLAQALLMNAQCSGGSRSFAKEMRALKTRSAVAGHQKLQGPTERIVDADLTTTKEVAEELNVDHAMVVQHLEQGGKVKNFDKWLPHELTKNIKNHCFEVLSYFM